MAIDGNYQNIYRQVIKGQIDENNKKTDEQKQKRLDEHSFDVEYETPTENDAQVDQVKTVGIVVEVTVLTPFGVDEFEVSDALRDMDLGTGKVLIKAPYSDKMAGTVSHRAHKMQVALLSRAGSMELLGNDLVDKINQTISQLV